MPDTEWPFGQFLADAVRDSGLSVREIGRRAEGVVGPSRIAQLIKGEPRGSTTVETVEALSRILGFDLDEGLRLAGLTMPKNWRRPTDPLDETWSVDEMLAALRGRFAALQAADLPPITRAQRRARGHTVTRLVKMAEATRESDPAGADLICALADRLHAQLEAMASGSTRRQQLH